MEVYHLGLAIYAKQLSGEGAKLHGGRWNLIGHPCIYTAETKALCALEYAANVLLAEMPYNLSFTTYLIPDEHWGVFDVKSLPHGWQQTPAPQATKEWGTKHLLNHLALKLPSVVIPSEFNFIINTLHPDFKKVRIKEVESFTFDRRIKQ